MQTGQIYKKVVKKGTSTKRSGSVRPTVETARYEELAADLLENYLISGNKSLVRKKNGNARVPGEAHLRRFFAGWNAEDITTGAVRKFVRKRQGEGASNGTIGRELAMLRRMFSLAVKARRLTEAPHIEIPKPNNVRTGFLEPEQYRRLRHELPGYLRPLSSLAYFTGMRRREICSLQLEQVNFFDAEIRLDPGTTKNDEGRSISLTGELLQILKTQLEKRDAECPDCPFVFFRVRRRSGHAQWLPIGDFRKAWRQACIRAGFGKMEQQENGRLRYRGLIFHDLRRSAVRNLVRAGVPERVAMKVSGHKTRSVFDRYNIVSPRDLQEAASRLDKYLGECRTSNVPAQDRSVDNSLLART